MEILEIIMDIIIMDIMYWNYVLELYMENYIWKLLRKLSKLLWK